MPIVKAFSTKELSKLGTHFATINTTKGERFIKLLPLVKVLNLQEERSKGGISMMLQLRNTSAALVVNDPWLHSPLYWYNI